MEAFVDGYAQMRVEFSLEDLSCLEVDKRIEGGIWRFTSETGPEIKRFLVYLRKAGRMKAFSIPRKGVWEEKDVYIVRLVPEALTAMRAKKFVGIGPLESLMRNVHISLEGVE